MVRCLCVARKYNSLLRIVYTIGHIWSYMRGPPRSAPPLSTVNIPIDDSIGRVTGHTHRTKLRGHPWYSTASATVDPTACFVTLTTGLPTVLTTVVDGIPRGNPQKPTKPTENHSEHPAATIVRYAPGIGRKAVTVAHTKRHTAIPHGSCVERDDSIEWVGCLSTTKTGMNTTSNPHQTCSIKGAGGRQKPWV